PTRVLLRGTGRARRPRRRPRTGAIPLISTTAPPARALPRQSPRRSSLGAKRSEAVRRGRAASRRAHDAARAARGGVLRENPENPNPEPPNPRNPGNPQNLRNPKNPENPT